jgi:hypothetical protein
MKKIVMVAMLCLAILQVQAQKKPSKATPKYDTIIRKHVEKPQPVTKPEVVLPVPEFINQPYYYDKNDNRLVKLESSTAQLISKKKTLGLKGAKQFFSMDGASSKIRFTTKTNITFFIKTSGDVIDLTSYIKLYKFISDNEKREVTITSKEGMLNDKEEQKGRQVPLSVKMISKDNYMIQFGETLEAGEYGFVWVKNMELKEFTVHAFAIDWKSSD